MNERLMELENKIQNKYCDARTVEQELQKIKNEAPAELSGMLPQEVLNKKPWNKKYLNELHDRFICGARNEKTIVHMAKVSRFVHVMNVVLPIALVVFIGCITSIIISLFKRG